MMLITSVHIIFINIYSYPSLVVALLQYSTIVYRVKVSPNYFHLYYLCNTTFFYHNSIGYTV